jgi:predicted nucleic acid-binding protein
VSAYFLDTSALVKRYAQETGHQWVLALTDPLQGHDLYISQAALVEVVAALCAKARQGAITFTERDTLIANFRQDSTNLFAIRPITAAIYSAAGDLCMQHKLRAYDAVQLACALAVRDDTIALGALAPIFVCADNDLLAVAIAESLSIENPNNHP